MRVAEAGVGADAVLQLGADARSQDCETSETARGERRLLDLLRVEHVAVGSVQRMQDSFLQRPDRDKADGSHRHQVALGVRQENGMTLFGNREEINLASGEKRTVETWQSDLGVAATFVEKGPATQTVRILTNLHRIEPNPKLFEIPAEYLPHPTPLLDGKKVFVDNETGVPEVGDAAVAQFNAFGPSKHPWVVVGSMDEADIVAVFAP